jgi:hypothetical protein
MQAWYAGEGESYDVVIGVRRSAEGFQAHAWLEGEAGGGFTELTRYAHEGAWDVVDRGSDEPRTTVVIPAWDEPYSSLVAEAADSVSAQARTTDLVVVDNCSVSDVAAPSGARVVHSDRRLTRGEARNLALKDVKTEFVLFLDADDLLLPGALERLESQMDADPEGAACAMSILEGEVGSAVVDRRHSVPRKFVPALSRVRPLFAMACAAWPLYSTQGATLIRTSSISTHAYADADGGEDWALALSLALRGVTVLRQPGLLYRRHPKGSGWADPASSGYMPQGAAGVRQRLRSDPAAPPWLRLLLPAVWAAHVVLLRALWPLKVRLARR